MGGPLLGLGLDPFPGAGGHWERVETPDFREGERLLGKSCLGMSTTGSEKGTTHEGFYFSKGIQRPGGHASFGTLSEGAPPPPRRCSLPSRASRGGTSGTRSRGDVGTTGCSSHPSFSRKYSKLPKVGLLLLFSPCLSTGLCRADGATPSLCPLRHPP